MARRAATTLPQVEPIIPVARAQPFDDPAYLFEPKYDGFRGLLNVTRQDCYFRSKRGNVLKQFKELAYWVREELAAKEVILDGEVVAPDPQGRQDFRGLLAGRGNLHYVAFDALWMNGKDLRRLPLTRRKRALSRVIWATTTVVSQVFSVEERGRDLFAAAERLDLEGIVAKRKGDPYGRRRSGTRGRIERTLRGKVGGSCSNVGVSTVMTESQPREPFARWMCRRVASTALLAVAGCGQLFYDDRCGEESRDVSADARILSPDGDSTGYASVSLGEQREGDKSIWWFVVSTDLRNHIQTARLVASEDTSGVLVELPGVVGGWTALEGDLTPYVGPPDFDDLFARAVGDGFTLVLSTDLPARRVVALPLHRSVFNDWGRPHCS